MKFSSNQIAKAMQKATSVTEQNQVMETVSIDVADIFNQLLNFDHLGVPPAVVVVPKNVKDVQHIAAQANFRLRMLLAKLGEK